MKKVVVASVLAVATGAAYCLPAALALDDGQTQGAQSGQITIKDPAEYNAYTNAVGQSSPAPRIRTLKAGETRRTLTKKFSPMTLPTSWPCW